MNFLYMAILLWICGILQRKSFSLARGRSGSAEDRDASLIQDDFGMHFILGFAANPLNRMFKRTSIFITIIPKSNGSVNVSYNNQLENTFSVFDGKPVVLPLPTELVMVAVNSSTRKGIEIESTAEIAVVCAYTKESPTSRKPGSPVGYLAMPSRLLGKRYVLATGDDNGYFGLISAENNTKVNITFSTDVNFGSTDYHNGDTLYTTLDKLETIGISVVNGDLSGTVIESNHDIAVLSGSRCQKKGASNNYKCIYWMTFLNPVKRWGKIYVVSEKGGMYTVGMFAYYNDTDMEMLTPRMGNPNPREKDIRGRMVVKQWIHINDVPSLFKCSKPCQVIQYVNQTIDKFGPLMYNVSPKQQFLSNYKVLNTGEEKLFPQGTIVAVDKILIQVNTSGASFTLDIKLWFKFKVALKGDRRPMLYYYNSNAGNHTATFGSNKSFGLIFDKWTTTNKGAITIYDSFSHLIDGSTVSTDSSKPVTASPSLTTLPKISTMTTEATSLTIPMTTEICVTLPTTSTAAEGTISPSPTKSVTTKATVMTTVVSTPSTTTGVVPPEKEGCKNACHISEHVNSSNVDEVLGNVNNVLSTPNDINAGDVDIVVNVLEKIVGLNSGSEEVVNNVLGAFDSLLDLDETVLARAQQQGNASKRAIETLNDQLARINVTEEKPFTKTLKNLAFDISIADTSSFNGLTFSATMNRDKSIPLDPKNIIKTKTDKSNSDSPNGISISLPKTLLNETAETTGEQSQTLIFTLFKQTKLFQSGNSSLEASAFPKLSLNSFVVSGDVRGKSVHSLKAPVVLTFSTLEQGNATSASCVYWNVPQSHWSGKGCTFAGTRKDGRVTCNCDHLTSFAILMDINVGESTGHEEALSIISYIGCAVSLVGLLLTMLTVLMFRDLRKNAPTQILLNFCISLSLTLIVFLAGAETSKTFSMTGCRIAAIALHYFVLTTFMWMAVSAFNMYLAFVRVMNSYFPKFMLKCCIVAWGLPAVIVAVTIGVALDDYGDSKYCRIHGVPFLAAFLAPVLLILLLNTIAFILIFHSLLKVGSKVTVDLKITGYQQARQGAAIFVLLGLTWVFGVLAISDAKIVFQYLFCIFNSLQGLFVFLLYCLLSPSTREKYRRLCGKRSRYKMPRIGTTDTASGKDTGIRKGDTEMHESSIAPYTLSTGVNNSGHS